MTSINIPNSITTISEAAFQNCTGLTSLTFHCKSIGNWFNYNYKKNITKVTIGNEVETIGSSAFSGFSELTSIIIPNSVTSIGSTAFVGCTGLSNVRIEDGENALKFSDSNYYKTFANCAITSLYLGRNLTYDSNYSPFRSVNSLKDVTIGNNVTSIGNSAFYGCSDLSSITIPNSVTSIDNNAFYGCNSINTITLSSNLMSIGNEAFPTHKTTNVIIEDLSSWITFDLSTWKANPLNNSEECCFILNGTEIRELIIPEGVQSISSGVFYNGKNITSVTFPQSVTSIGWSAFYGCTGLTSIEIPSSVTSIGYGAFSGCTGLKSFTVHNNRPPSATSGITSQEVYDNCILYVPEGSENIYYASTFWNAFKTIQTIGAVEKVPQDVNGDGIVDTQDVLEIYKYIQEH